MPLSQDNHMVHALAPDRSDQPFSKAVLPRGCWCNWLVPDAHGAQSACDDSAIDLIPITDEVSALQTKFIRDHLFYVENGCRANECCFSIVRHSFQRTLPIAEAFQTIRIRK